MASDRDDDYRDDDRPRRRRDDDDDGGGRRRDIPNNLVIAILSVFCCWPLAIVAIINAAKVNGLVAQGKYSEAQAAADNAKKFALIGIVVGLVVNVVAVILQVVAAGAAGGGR